MNARVLSSLPEVNHIEPVQQLAIKAVDVVKSYGFRPTIRDVSFSIQTGTTTALLGANGAGKTTLLRMLATLAKPTSGRLVVNGLDVRHDAAAIRRQIGFVAHQPHVYEDLTLVENLVYFAQLYGISDSRARALSLLEWVGLRKRAGDRANSLSRGQTQRLAIARGIIHEPSLLLMDEPDTGLDEEGQALLETLVREREASRRTTVLTTHQLERGLLLCSRAMVLVKGRLVFDGNAAGLTASGVRELYHAGNGAPR